MFLALALANVWCFN